MCPLVLLAFFMYFLSMIVFITLLIKHKKASVVVDYDQNNLPEASMFKPFENKLYPVSVRLSFSDPLDKKKVNLVFGNTTIEIPALGHQEIYEIPDNNLNKNSIQGMFRLEKVNNENSLKPIKKIMLFYQDDKNFIVREELLQNTSSNMAGYTFRNKLPLLGGQMKTPGVYIVEKSSSWYYPEIDPDSPEYIPELDPNNPAYNPRQVYINPKSSYYIAEWDPNNQAYDAEQDPFKDSGL